MSIIHEDSPDKYTVVDNVTTQFGARTMTLDPKTHHVFTETADFKPRRRRRRIIRGRVRSNSELVRDSGAGAAVNAPKQSRETQKQSRENKKRIGSAPAGRPNLSAREPRRHTRSASSIYQLCCIRLEIKHFPIGAGVSWERVQLQVRFWQAVFAARTDSPKSCNRRTPWGTYGERR